VEFSLKVDYDVDWKSFDLIQSSFFACVANMYRRQRSDYFDFCFGSRRQATLQKTSAARKLSQSLFSLRSKRFPVCSKGIKRLVALTTSSSFFSQVANSIAGKKISLWRCCSCDQSSGGLNILTSSAVEESVVPK
jgi:hypothetical protein